MNNRNYAVPTLEIGAIDPAVVIAQIERHIKQIYYRKFLSNEEIDNILQDIGAEWDFPRGTRGHTNIEVTNMLLDARLSLMTEGEGNVELQEELDALIGADIDSG